MMIIMFFLEVWRLYPFIELFKEKMNHFFVVERKVWILVSVKGPDPEQWLPKYIWFRDGSTMSMQSWDEKFKNFHLEFDKLRFWKYCTFPVMKSFS